MLIGDSAIHEKTTSNTQVLRLFQLGRIRQVRNKRKSLLPSDALSVEGISHIKINMSNIILNFYRGKTAVHGGFSGRSIYMNKILPML